MVNKKYIRVEKIIKDADDNEIAYELSERDYSNTENIIDVYRVDACDIEKFKIESYDYAWIEKEISERTMYESAYISGRVLAWIIDNIGVMNKSIKFNNVSDMKRVYYRALSVGSKVLLGDNFIVIYDDTELRFISDREMLIEDSVLSYFKCKEIDFNDIRLDSAELAYAFQGSSFNIKNLKVVNMHNRDFCSMFNDFVGSVDFSEFKFHRNDDISDMFMGAHMNISNIKLCEVGVDTFRDFEGLLDITQSDLCEDDMENILLGVKSVKLIVTPEQCEMCSNIIYNYNLDDNIDYEVKETY